jgi:DNA-directed RNA polymerase specialized sigma subunit
MSDQPGRFYALPAPERDRLVVALRQRGWTLKRIGRRVGMSGSGVSRSLQRIREGGQGMTRD